MCAQSPVLKTMLDSDLWAESKNKEVCISALTRIRCLGIMLTFGSNLKGIVTCLTIVVGHTARALVSQAM